jgi:hypothetical protein
MADWQVIAEEFGEGLAGSLALTSASTFKKHLHTVISATYTSPLS